MAQLIEMGFSRKSVEAAMNTVSGNFEANTVENLVAWLLEYSEECSLSVDRRNIHEQNTHSGTVNNSLNAVTTKVSLMQGVAPLEKKLSQKLEKKFLE